MECEDGNCNYRNYVSLHRYSLEFTNISVVFFETQEILEKKTITVSSVIPDNNELGKNVLAFSDTSNNEASVALGVVQYLNYNGSVGCICHTQ